MTRSQLLPGENKLISGELSCFEPILAATLNVKALPEEAINLISGSIVISLSELI